jgi:hypothetical protein
MAQRVGEVYDLIRTQASYRLICRYASARWGLTPPGRPGEIHQLSEGDNVGAGVSCRLELPGGGLER